MGAEKEKGEREGEGGDRGRGEREIIIDNNLNCV
jgi:hypothetical protein